MNKLSKLTALLLALLMAFAAPMAAVAEETTVIKTIETLADYLQVADTALYEKIMSFDSYGEYAPVAYYLDDNMVLEYIANNDVSRVQEIQAHLSKLYWDACRSYTGATGPLFTTDNVSTYALRSITRGTGFTDSEALELFKKADINPDGEGYVITLEAYAEGTVTKHTTGTPVDVVVVMDLSNSMEDDFYGQNRIVALKAAVKDFIASDKTTDTNGNTSYESGIASTYSKDDDLSTIDMDHRIALVGYSSDIRVNTGWMDADGQDLQDLLDTVDRMTTSTGTRTDLGLQRAEELFTTPTYTIPSTNPNAPRQKVVVLFTDGVPTTSSNFNVVDAAGAINSAYNLKDPDQHNAKVYSIAIFPYANPATTLTSIETIVDTKYTVAGNGKTAKAEGDAVANKVNLMLHAISSNYIEATATTNQSSRNGNASGDSARLYVTLGTRNPNSANSSYYMTAANPDDLTSKFQNIASEINQGSTTIDLGTETVLKDVVTPYFTMPAGASAVNVYTVDCVGFNYDADGKPTTPIWATNTDGSEKRVLLPQATSATDAAVAAGTACYVSISGQTIDVKGFDYSKNYVAPAADNHVDPLGKIATGKFMGRKLVVEFVVTPEPGFLGGDQVDTNEATSGIYEVVDGAETPFEGFTQPKVDIAVPPLKIVGEDQHIYLGNNASLDDLLQSFSVYYDIMGDTDNDGVDDDYVSGRHKVDSILNHYVQLDFTLYLDTNKNGVVDSGDTEYASYSIAKEQQSGQWTYNEEIRDFLRLAFTDDVTPFVISYKATATEPTYVDGVMTDPGNYSEGSMTANIYVYKPQVTFQDTRHEFHTAATADGYYDANNYVKDSLKWYNAKLQQYSTEATITDAETGNTVNAMLGTPPTLTFTYALDSGTWITNNVVTGTACVPVNVTNVLIDGDNDITINASTNANSGYLTTNRMVINCTDCNNKDGTTTPTDVANNTIFEFVVHIYNVYGKLKITKTGLKDGESAIFKVYNATQDSDGNYTRGTLYTDVVLTGDGSGNAVFVTLGELYPDTSYYVEEASGWSWSYTVSPTSAGATIVANDTVTVSFSNTKNDQWLHDENGIVNNFGTGTKTDLDNQGGE